MRQTTPADYSSIARAQARPPGQDRYRLRSLALLLVPYVLGTMLLGCIPDQRHDVGGVVMVPPPAVRIETAGAPPAANDVWLAGYWAWVGDRYEWVSGHWSTPRPGRHWVPHQWVRQGDGWRMKPGHWERG